MWTPTPNEMRSLCKNWVVAKLDDGSTKAGLLYTIDPVTYSTVLIGPPAANDSPLNVNIIPGKILV